MAITRISRTFKDISLSFTPHPVTKDLPILKNENSIVRSVRNLVQTIPTERFFNSNLGSDVQDSLFGFVDYGTASLIEDQIVTVVTNFEPRVENVEVEVEPQVDNNTFGVIIKFDVVGQAFPPQEFAFLLETTR